MSMPYIHHRKKLAGLRRAFNRNSVTFGFIGGSITDARPRYNWPQYFIESFISTYPNIKCKVENAAIGATGSDLAVFRCERDLINRQCDVVFIEYAVNDEDVEAVRRFRTREGLIRQLLKAGIADIIVIYTYSEKMKEAIDSGKYPESIAHFEQLANYYDLPSVWVGKYGYDQVLNNRITMGDWLPDGLHPLEKGSRLYAELVSQFMEAELARDVSSDDSSVRPKLQTAELALPLDALCWENTSSLSLDALSLNGKWQQYRWHDYEWIDTMLETKDSAASFNFSFTGRGIVFVFDFGKDSYEFSYRINNGAWRQSNRDCPDWVGHEGWYRLFELDTDLPYMEHKVEVNIVECEQDKGKEKHFRLGRVGVLL